MTSKKQDLADAADAVVEALSTLSPGTSDKETGDAIQAGDPPGYKDAQRVIFPKAGKPKKADVVALAMRIHPSKIEGATSAFHRQGSALWRWWLAGLDAREKKGKAMASSEENQILANLIEEGHISPEDVSTLVLEALKSKNINERMAESIAATVKDAIDHSGEAGGTASSASAWDDLLADTDFDEKLLRREKLLKKMHEAATKPGQSLLKMAKFWGLAAQLKGMKQEAKIAPMMESLFSNFSGTAAPVIREYAAAVHKADTGMTSAEKSVLDLMVDKLKMHPKNIKSGN